MAWMRETGIRILMQTELKTCCDKLDWLIICLYCASYNCPEEEYPPRPLPVPPDHIDNLQIRLVKVKKAILPATLKTILKTYYHLPAHQAPVYPQQHEIPSCPQKEELKTSPAVQPDDMERHRDGEHHPLERPHVLKDEEKVVTDGTWSTDQGGDLLFQIEVGMDHEASQVAAREFELAMFRQQQGTTATSIHWGGDYSIQADFTGKSKAATTAPVAPREEAAISRQQRGAASTEQNQKFDPGG